MHDAIIAEGLGLPAVGIMTSAFKSAAELMAKVKGAAGYQFVETVHPISSASVDALSLRAAHAATLSVELLLGND